MEVKNKNILITGGASGFGLAAAYELSKLKANVIIIDNNNANILELKKLDPELNIIHADVTNFTGIGLELRKIHQEFGPIDVLINNAGVMESAPLVNITAKENRAHSMELWNKVINVNLNAPFHLTSLVVDEMLKNRKKGLVINIGSISSNGNVGQSAYSASKAGLESLSKVWAKELGLFGIRSVAIAPGFCNTKGAFDALEERLLKSWIAKVPLKRLGTEQEFVSAVLFTINNDFYNGKVLELDGGLTL